MSGTIVVGYVRTPEGRAAIDAALAEATRRAARLVVVNSVRGGEEDPEQVTALHDELLRLEERIAGEGVKVELHEYARGNHPAQDLLQDAAEVGADLIVIGLRHRSPVGKLFLGSTAQDVLLSARCPVLAVKVPVTSAP